MNLRVFLAIAAAIAIVYGVAFVLMPAFVLATYGMTTEPSTILSARYFGLTLFGLGLIVWMIRDTSDGKVLRGLLAGLAVQTAIGVLVSVWGTLGGTMNAMGWSAVLIYAVLLAGYVYFLFTSDAVASRV